MRNLFVYGSFMIVFVLGALLVSDSGTLWGQEDPQLFTSKGKAGQNLQILAIDSIEDLKNTMKTITKSLGVDCKFCHILTDFTADVDTLQKNKSRQMITMVTEINEKYFKDSKIQITCFTCHRGYKKPVMTLDEWNQVQEEEKKKS